MIRDRQGEDDWKKNAEFIHSSVAIIKQNLSIENRNEINNYEWANNEKLFWFFKISKYCWLLLKLKIH